MGFLSRFRSTRSTSNDGSCPRHFSLTSLFDKGGARSHENRRHSVYAQPMSARDAAVAHHRAQRVFEEEEARIMREELRQRDQNDRECKRQMKMLEKAKWGAEWRLEDQYNLTLSVSKVEYQAGKISSREFDSICRNAKKAATKKRDAYLKKYTKEQDKAQRIFFDRGEEIGANTGAALRKARQKMDRAQRIAIV